MLRATTACTFLISQLQKVLRTRQFLALLTWRCASRYNGVQFFISHLASWLRTRRLASLLFDLPEPQIIGKTQCFATFLPFRAPGSSFFRDFLFFDLLSSSLLFSGSSHLCSSSVHIVGSLTSKLPSTTPLHYTTLHYTNYTTLHYNCIYHYIAPHDATLQLQLHDFTLQYIGNTTLYHATVQNATVHYNTLH